MCYKSVGICFLVLILFLCPMLLFSSSIDNDIYLNLFQDRKYISVDDLSIIQLKRKPFKLVFPLREYDIEKKEFYSARITASTNVDILSLKPGQERENIPFFTSGTGLASGLYGYDSLFLTENAHHYIIYNSKNESIQRANIIAGYGDGRYEVEWLIYNINDKPIRKFEQDILYIVVFIDNNLDNILDKGEFFRFAIHFVD